MSPSSDKLLPFDLTSHELQLPAGRLLLEASAGTGKTFSITGIVLRLVLDGKLSIGQILVVTFTRAATQELRDRIRSRLASAARILKETPDAEPIGDAVLDAAIACARIDRPTARRRITQAHLQADEIAIHTIDAFCQRILSECTFEAGAEPRSDNEETTPDTRAFTSALIDDACRARILGRNAATIALHAPVANNPLAPDNVRDAVSKLLAYPDAIVVPEIPSDAPDAASLAATLSALADRWAGDESDGLFNAIDSGTLKLNGDKYFSSWRTRTKEPGDGQRRFLALREMLAAPDRDRLLPSITWDHLAKIAGTKLDTSGFPILADTVRWLGDLRRHAVVHIRTLATHVRQAKAAARLMDFADIQQATLDALESDDARGGRLKSRLRRRFQVALVDEAQDTSPAQARMFSLIFDDTHPPLPSATMVPGKAYARPSDRSDPLPLTVDRLPLTADRLPLTADRLPLTSLRLYLIGDPKQAIYRFRGADIVSYIREKHATAAQGAGHLYSLASNFRSSQPLLEALNAWYAAAPDAFDAGSGFASRSDFAYQDVASGDPGKPWTLCDASGRELPPFRIECFEQLEPGETPDKPDSAGTQRHNDLELLCRHIEALVCPGSPARLKRRGRPDEAPRRIVAGDIAVLVHRNLDATRVHQQLTRRGIPCVLHTDKTIWETDEARDIALVLEGLIDPRDASAVRRALLTPFAGLRPDAVHALLADDDGTAWTSVVDTFVHLHQFWKNQGVATALRAAMDHFGTELAHAVVAGGERRLSNWRQLAELLQTISLESGWTPADTLRELRRRIATGADGEGADETHQLRLESDERAVQVVTIHKSKGLEYPIVFLPFSWCAKPRDAAKCATLDYHDDAHRRVLHIGSDPADRAIAEARHTAEEQETLARLLYVALTRAMAANIVFIAWKASRRNLAHADSALYRHLGWNPGDTDIPSFTAHVAAWIDARKAAAPDRFDAAAPLLIPAPAAAPEATPAAFIPARPFTRSPDTRRMLTSFTALTSGAEATHASEATPPPPNLPSPVTLNPSPFTLNPPPVTLNPCSSSHPEGSPGLLTPPSSGLLHSVPQRHLRAASAPSPFTLHPSPFTLNPCSSSHPEGSPGLLPPPSSGLLHSVPQRHLRAASAPSPLTLHPSPLTLNPPYTAPHRLRGGATLGNLFHETLERVDFTTPPTAWTEAIASRLRKYPVQLADPSEPLTAGTLSTIIQRILDTPLESDGPRPLTLHNIPLARTRREWEFVLPAPDLTRDKLVDALRTSPVPLPQDGLVERIAGLAPSTIDGFLKGSIDLVFTDDDGRYHLLDWKTNRLGDCDDDYTPEAVDAAMLHSAYPLQCLLYACALHRHLAFRLGTAYDPARHLGHAHYLFVRGMSPAAPGRAVWNRPLDPTLIQHLCDKLFTHPC